MQESRSPLAKKNSIDGLVLKLNGDCLGHAHPYPEFVVGLVTSVLIATRPSHLRPHLNLISSLAVAKNSPGTSFLYHKSDFSQQSRLHCLEESFSITHQRCLPPRSRPPSAPHACDVNVARRKSKREAQLAWTKSPVSAAELRSQVRDEYRA